jgi:hypothetical protein
MNEDVLALIQQLINAVETAAPKVWEVMLRQVTIEGWTNLAWGVLVLLIFVGMWLGAIRAARKSHIAARWYQDGSLDKEDLRMIAMFLGIVSAIPLLVAAFLLTDAVRMLANPDYYAALRLMELVP